MEPSKLPLGPELPEGTVFIRMSRWSLERVLTAVLANALLVAIHHGTRTGTPRPSQATPSYAKSANPPAPGSTLMAEIVHAEAQLARVQSRQGELHDSPKGDRFDERARKLALELLARNEAKLEAKVRKLYLTLDEVDARTRRPTDGAFVLLTPPLQVVAQDAVMECQPMRFELELHPATWDALTLWRHSQDIPAFERAAYTIWADGRLRPRLDERALKALAWEVTGLAAGVRGNV